MNGTATLKRAGSRTLLSGPKSIPCIIPFGPPCVTLYLTLMSGLKARVSITRSNLRGLVGPVCRCPSFETRFALLRMRWVPQLNLTYSKSAGWPLMPRCGGAIQLANLPGSMTAGPISEVT